MIIGYLFEIVCGPIGFVLAGDTQIVCTCAIRGNEYERRQMEGGEGQNMDTNHNCQHLPVVVIIHGFVVGGEELLLQVTEEES